MRQTATRTRSSRFWARGGSEGPGRGEEEQERGGCRASYLESELLKFKLIPYHDNNHNNQLWSIRWARKTRTYERELSLWRKTRGSGCFKDRLDRVTAETRQLTRIYRWPAQNPFMINKQAGYSGSQSPISGKNLIVLNIKLYKILKNIDFIIWQCGCTGLGDWDIGHWHGKDQQWRWPGSWSGWRKVGHRSCSWRCCRRCFEDAAEDVGEYAVADVVVQVINVKGFKYSRGGNTSNEGYCPRAKSLSLSTQMCPNVST